MLDEEKKIVHLDLLSSQMNLLWQKNLSKEMLLKSSLKSKNGNLRKETSENSQIEQTEWNRGTEMKVLKDNV